VLLWWQQSIASSASTTAVTSIMIVESTISTSTSTSSCYPASWVTIIAATATTTTPYWRKRGCGSCNTTTLIISQLHLLYSFLDIWPIQHLPYSNYGISINAALAKTSALSYPISMFQFHTQTFRSLIWVLNEAHNWWKAPQNPRWHSLLFSYFKALIN
jgi:hypothetical protein